LFSSCIKLRPLPGLQTFYNFKISLYQKCRSCALKSFYSSLEYEGYEEKKVLKQYQNPTKSDKKGGGEMSNIENDQSISQLIHYLI
jgi:hypothetical protein